MHEGHEATDSKQLDTRVEHRGVADGFVEQAKVQTHVENVQQGRLLAKEFDRHFIEAFSQQFACEYRQYYQH